MSFCFFYFVVLILGIQTVRTTHTNTNGEINKKLLEKKKQKPRLKDFLRSSKLLSVPHNFYCIHS